MSGLDQTGNEPKESTLIGELNQVIRLTVKSRNIQQTRCIQDKRPASCILNIGSYLTYRKPIFRQSKRHIIKYNAFLMYSRHQTNEKNTPNKSAVY